MITAGIDCGARNVRVIVLRSGQVLGRGELLAGVDTAAAAEEAYHAALQQAGLGRGEVARVVATGAGRNEPRFKDDIITEVAADARGMHLLQPEVRTVIDVGAEEGRAIKIDERGQVMDFAVNERCAAGAGAFTEAMARALEVSLEELGELSLESTQAIPMNASCVVFAESEVVALLHRRTAKADMARAILESIADRIASMVRRVGIDEKVAVIGGVARNVGFIRSLEEDLETELVLVDQLEFVGAIGAAAVAADE